MTTSFKALVADLQTTISGTYSQTGTTIFGNAAQRTFQSTPVISPPPIKWLDIFTDSGETAVVVTYTPNGRVFAMTAITAGLARVMCYSFNATTGVSSYIGKIQMNFPNTAATTHTIRGFKVDDASTSNIKIFACTTGSVPVNGGTFMGYGIALTDFTNTLSVTLPFATGSAQKAVYSLQDSAGVGGGNLNTLSAGLSLDRSALVLYTHNGTAATHQFYSFDYSATPNVPSSTVTITIAAPGVVTQTAHGYNANDQVVFATTGNLPTGLVAGTVYFVRNPATNTYEVSATSGGASITTTGTQAGTQSVTRAFGETISLQRYKTGNLPALTGTLLTNNSERQFVPSAANPQTGLIGFSCVFFATTTNLYAGKLSDLTNGGTGWASLVGVNLLGATNQVVTPTAVNATYDDYYDVAVFTTSATKIIAKPLSNNVINGITGILNNDYLEGVSTVGTTTTTETGAISISDIANRSGWTLLLGSSTGQRGVIAANVGADILADQLGLASPTYMTTKVMNLTNPSTLIGVALSDQSPQLTSNPTVYYRTSGFGSATGGWILLPTTLLFPALTTATQVQFKVGWSLTNSLVTNPSFAIELYLAYASQYQGSDNWALDIDSSTQGTLITPNYVAWTLVSTSGTVPSILYAKGYDTSGTGIPVLTKNTSANSSLFSISTDGGTSWSAFVSVAALYSAGVGTKIRLNNTSPSGTLSIVSLGETA